MFAPTGKMAVKRSGLWKGPGSWSASQTLFNIEMDTYKYKNG